MKIELPLRILKGLYHLTSKDDTRYVLCGVLLQPHGKFLRCVATDGRRMGIILLEPHEFDSDLDSQIIVPNEAILKMSQRESNVSNGLTRIEVLPNELRFGGRPRFVTDRYDAKYPKYQNAFPKEPMASIAEFNFDAQLMAGFSECVRVAFRDRSPLCIQSHYGEHGGFSIFCNSDKFYGVLMPTRPRREKQPDWITEMTKEAP